MPRRVSENVETVVMSNPLIYFARAGKIPVTYEEQHYQYLGGTADEVLRLQEYVVQDAELVGRLLYAHLTLLTSATISNITHTSIQDVFQRGMQIRSYNKIVKMTHGKNVIVNQTPLPQSMQIQEYEGATVLTPVVGFHGNTIDDKGNTTHVKVPVWDFASLYPSIQMSFNLCYWNLMEKSDEYARLIEKNNSDEKPTMWDYLACFDKTSKDTFIPKMQEELKMYRGEEKKKMKNAYKMSMDLSLTEEERLKYKNMHRSHDGAQMGIKVCTTVTPLYMNQ